MLYLLFNVALLISSVKGVLSKEGVAAESERVLVGFPSHLREEVKQAAEALGARLEVELHRVDAIAVTLPTAARALLEAHPAVSYVEEDAIMTATGEQTTWGWYELYTDYVWDANSGKTKGNGAKVCVVDGGLNWQHKDLAGLKILNTNSKSQWEYIGCSHGTHVTGTISAQKNSKGIRGIAPDAGIYTVRVFDGGDCYTYNSRVLNGVEECMEHNVDVINLSLGGYTNSSTANSLYNSALQQNIVVVAAAGNDGSSAKEYPASYSNVISVAALGLASNDDFYVPGFSNYNNAVDLTAPGVNVRSTVPGNKYEYWDGTSMAVPHVAGVAALLFSAKPSASATQVINCMKYTAIYNENGQYNDDMGHGFVQADYAHACIMTLNSPQPPTYEKKDLVFKQPDF